MKEIGSSSSCQWLKGINLTLIYFTISLLLFPIPAQTPANSNEKCCKLQRRNCVKHVEQEGAFPFLCLSITALTPLKFNYTDYYLDSGFRDLSKSNPPLIWTVPSLASSFLVVPSPVSCPEEPLSSTQRHSKEIDAVIPSFSEVLWTMLKHLLFTLSQRIRSQYEGEKLSIHN